MANTPELSYNGIGLLFDADQQAQKFLDRYLPIQDLISPPCATARDDWHGNTYGQGRAGLPRPNYPPPPPPRVNTLYWPTGAARWARGWFLCDQAGKDALTDFNGDDSVWLDGYAVPGTLKLSTPSMNEDLTPYVLEAEMHLLRPLPISATGDSVYGDLWLLPLVDARYWWQFARCGDLSTALDTWAELVGTLATRLGASIDTPTADDAYMIPDRIELSRSEDNAAVVLDAVAHSIGRRVVVAFDGSVKLERYQDAKSQLETNRTEATTGDTRHLRLMAGTLDSKAPPPAYPWPDEVRIAFQKIEDPSDTGAASFWTTATTADAIASTVGAQDLVTVEDTTKTVHCSAWAMFQCGGSTTNPANKTNLEALCLQYAKDFYGWLLYQYDYCWPGVQKWVMTGYDDHLLIEAGVEYVDEIEAIGETDERDVQSPDVLIRERLERRYSTRVQSMPGNFGVSSLLCQYEHAIPGVADDIVVETPSGGIDGVSSGLIATEACKVYETVPAGSTASWQAVYCDDSNTHWEIRVGNVSTTAVGGSKKAVTSLLSSGFRYISVEAC